MGTGGYGENFQGKPGYGWIWVWANGAERGGSQNFVP